MEHVYSLVSGGMPNTVGSMIAESDLKDLGVHTEMYVMRLLTLQRQERLQA